ncbi:M56 family metallopeptidase [Alteribacillus iranensis]|uniref:Zn-dependent protease with chaperone function n=1 Tax=Alteribacillus iranensis TaxID=930128 RepID=A0A1I2DUC9_9BACI|nr:M56 family metallopeptidase [Alteribacillus iranensis]SFE83853.1 Zn-dependent protease with chaperone function [Alteribacillus iranensis]
MVLVITVLVYLFIQFSFGQAMILMAFGASAYSAYGLLIDKRKKEKRMELKQRLQEVKSIEIYHERNVKRIVADLVLTFLVCLGAVFFFLFAPDTYAVLKMFIGFMLLSMSAQMVERIGNFSSTRLYWLPDEERLVILSWFQSRDFPLQDLKEAGVETSPDLLRLHPLFTFLSSNQDFTVSFKQVLKLSFPEENIYLTPCHAEKWKEVFESFAEDTNEKEEKNVLPLWHPTILKRLFWKGYFAITVKGISAYTGLLIILIWLDVPGWSILLFVSLWWLLNVCVSDRVLIAATDAVPVTEGEIYDRAQVIFGRAGVSQTRLFIVDSPVQNGLATGMNIGRATVMLTTATLRLPQRSVEAILAHEATHVKKRDVLTNQLARMTFLGVFAGLIFLFFDELRWAAENQTVVLFLIVYALIMIFPIYLSFVGQWTEGRADHLGATYLIGGSKQMAEGLSDLANAQDRDLDKSFEYKLSDKGSSRKSSSSVERDSWFWRFIEFQFQVHPPMYWRIQSLSNDLNWREARKDWLIDRIKESMPDFLRKKEASKT